VAEALRAGAAVEALFVEPGRLGPSEHAVVSTAEAAGVPVHELEPGVAARVGSSTTPQPLFGIVGMVDVGIAALVADGLVLVCDGVSDPGNLGTILRSAEAAGARGVVCAAGSVDPYNSKCVRASAGALFHIPVVLGDETMQVLEQLSGRGFRRFGTSARTGTSLWDADLSGAVAVVLGNEAHGVDASVDAHLDGVLSIPIAGRSESLNVGVAAAVVAFEAARQRGVGHA
jgi:TrmH family RNA methyltransferase